jgi:hypothetical protein
MYALQALRERGGLPPDAILTEISGERMISTDATSPAAGHQMSYVYVWRPPVIGAEDRVLLTIASSESTHCTRADCNAYDVSYGLYVEMFFRKWTPSLQREHEQQALRKGLIPAPLPNYVNSSCLGGAVNVPALRRVSAALGEHADSRGVYRPVVEGDLLKQPAWVYARFSPFTVRRRDPQLRRGESIEVRAVAVGDVPASGQRYIEILTRERSPRGIQDWWKQFIDNDQEPVCMHPPRVLAVSPNLSGPALSPAAIPYDALERSQAEAMWTRNSSKNFELEIVSEKRSPDGTSVVTSIRQGNGTTWRGSFWYDSKGVLVHASFLNE